MAYEDRQKEHELFQLARAALQQLMGDQFFWIEIRELYVPDSPDGSLADRFFSGGRHAVIAHGALQHMVLGRTRIEALAWLLAHTAYRLRRGPPDRDTSGMLLERAKELGVEVPEEWDVCQAISRYASGTSVAMTHPSVQMLSDAAQAMKDIVSLVFEQTPSQQEVNSLKARIEQLQRMLVEGKGWP